MPPNMSPDGLPEGMVEPELVPLERLVCKGAFGGGPLNGGGSLKGGFCFHLGGSEDVGPVVASDDDEAAFGGGPVCQ